MRILNVNVVVLKTGKGEKKVIYLICFWIISYCVYSVLRKCFMYRWIFIWERGSFSEKFVIKCVDWGLLG